MTNVHQSKSPLNIIAKITHTDSVEKERFKTSFPNSIVKSEDSYEKQIESEGCKVNRL